MYALSVRLYEFISLGAPPWSKKILPWAKAIPKEMPALEIDEERVLIGKSQKRNAYKRIRALTL
jgi:hypothetical protein